MRKVTIEYTEDGLFVEDCDGQWVSVVYDGADALFSSRLHGDDEVQHGKAAKVDAEMEALFLMGIPHDFTN